MHALLRAVAATLGHRSPASSRAATRLLAAARRIFATLAAGATAALVCQVPVTVVNPAPQARTGIVPVSVPMARGALRVAAALGTPSPLPRIALAVTGTGADGPRIAPGVPLTWWPDGSIAVLQAALPADVPAQSRIELQVTPELAAPGVARTIEPAPHRSLLQLPLPLWTELIDPWGRVFRADLVADVAAGEGGVLVDTGAMCVRRFRAPHRAVDGEPRGALFDLVAYLVTFDGERRAELTLVIDNREPSAGALGPVRMRGVRVCTADERLRFLPAFAREQGLSAPQRRAGGGHVQWLLGPTGDPYLGDGTAKAFRLHLFQDDPEVTAVERSAAAWAPLPLRAFAGLDAVRATRAFAAHGGPAPRAAADQGSAGVQLDLWHRAADFGPFGAFGDPLDGAIGGAPRHGEAMLHNALRWRSPELLGVAEGMVLQHTLRPTGGRAPRLPADTEPYREGLSAAAIARPHGFAPFAYEHCSAALLFDWYWLTGDALARDELARVGASVRALLPTVEFATGRGEGNALLAGVLAARATGDAALLGFLVERALTRIGPALEPVGSQAALAQPPHPLVFDGQTAFDAPAQMAMLVRGLAALHAATDDPRLLPLVQRVADVIAGPAWLEGEGPKTFVSSADPGRYTMAASPEDRSGADRMVIGALVLAAELAGDPADSARLRARAEFLLDRQLPADAGLPERLLAAANPWLQVALDRRKAP